jgi:hypothetical protein
MEPVIVICCQSSSEIEGLGWSNDCVFVLRAKMDFREPLPFCFVGEEICGVGTGGSSAASVAASFRRFGEDLGFFSFSLGVGGSGVAGATSFSAPFRVRDLDLDRERMPKKRDALDLRVGVSGSGSGSGAGGTSGNLTLAALRNSFSSWNSGNIHSTMPLSLSSAPSC